MRHCVHARVCASMHGALFVDKSVRKMVVMFFFFLDMSLLMGDVRVDWGNREVQDHDATAKDVPFADVASF